MKKYCIPAAILLMIPASLHAADLRMADPTILAVDGVYYLYGTSPDSGNGFDVFSSENLVDWTPRGKALAKGDAFGTTGFWAPQVLQKDGKYYMFYTADEHVAVAVADSPVGPFVNPSLAPVGTPTRCIDPFVFFESDGSAWLYHVKLDGGNKIYRQKLSADLRSVDAASASLVVEAENGWEDTAAASWRVAEGPTVMRADDGGLLLFYSCNDFRNPDYAVGIARADSRGEKWSKPEKPIISRHNMGVNGTGHGDVFTGLDGKLRYVFHTHASDTEVAPRRTAIVELIPDGNGSYKADSSSLIFLKASN